MSERAPEEIAAEMAQHYLALGALWNEWSRSGGRRRPKAIRNRKETVAELRRRIEGKVQRNG